jgi:predicted AlkP superfamily phosphohydrolase/phosphomutase
LTAPAWTTFLTGKTPGSHGIFDFFYRRRDSYSQSLHSIHDVKDLFFLDVLGENEKTVGTINLPFTYPPKPVNGFMISGLLTPHGSRDFVYPAPLLAEIEGAVGPYLLHHDQTGRPSLVLQQENELLEYRTSAALYLYRKHQTDFFMVHFYGTDRIQHEFWHILDETHPSFKVKAFEKYGDSIIDYYKTLDSSIEKLWANLDEDTTFIVMSDHGFGPIYQFMNVNQWLFNEGFLQLKNDWHTTLKKALFSMKFNYSNMAKLVLKFGFGKKAVQFGRAKRQKIQEAVFLSLRDIDWSKTKAYSIGNFGQIFINKAGREPEGIIDDRQYEDVCAEIERRLKQLKDPRTHSEVVDKVFRGKEIFQGDCGADAPDLFFLTKDMTTKPNGLTDFASKRVFENVFGSTGHHQLNGILIARHPAIIKRNHELIGARIVDMAPTILYLLGSAIPSDMDGEVIAGMFREGFVKSTPIRSSEGRGKADSEEKGAYTREEEEAVRNALKDLGYI